MKTMRFLFSLLPPWRVFAAPAGDDFLSNMIAPARPAARPAALPDGVELLQEVPEAVLRAQARYRERELRELRTKMTVAAARARNREAWLQQRIAKLEASEAAWVNVVEGLLREAGKTEEERVRLWRELSGAPPAVAWNAYTSGMLTGSFKPEPLLP